MRNEIFLIRVLGHHTNSRQAKLRPNIVWCFDRIVDKVQRERQPDSKSKAKDKRLHD